MKFCPERVTYLIPVADGEVVVVIVGFVAGSVVTLPGVGCPGCVALGGGETRKWLNTTPIPDKMITTRSTLKIILTRSL